MKHEFTEIIKQILKTNFDENAEQIFQNSWLIQYLNLKTVSANRGSKARGSFGNLYAIYVLVEDYLKHNFQQSNQYSTYEGAKFSDLLKRQRELPFGAKLQNHALNQRMNQEFKKYFPTVDIVPIVRVVKTKRYWINEHLLKVKTHDNIFNIAATVIEIIDKYIEVKTQSLQDFIETSEQLKKAENEQPQQVKSFILSLLAPNIDARIFEITSFAILKNYYINQHIFWGWTRETIQEETLKLYKTGRTNANDGGIDFVMKPLGRFFQVTETTDVKKYFLDIDKLEKYPLTFVVKSTNQIETLNQQIKNGAIEQFGIQEVVKNYMSCVEEIINIQKLMKFLDELENKQQLSEVLNDIIIQSKVEFHFFEN